MSGDWIKMRNNLWDDPRVCKLCDITGQSEAAIVGALYWLWSSADEHTEDGAMPGLSAAGIDRKTGVKGIGAALVDIGWISETEDGIRLERFEEHNGSSAKRRCMDAQRKANTRHASASDADSERTESGRKAPNLGAREEKRREEVKEVKALSDSAAPKPDGAPNGRKNRNVEARDVLSYLNEITGHAYRPVDANIRPIAARLTEGYTAARLREIAFRKHQEWGSDEKMAQYLRPETLYNATKCAQYDGGLPNEVDHG